MISTSEKESKIKEMHHLNAQLKNDLRLQSAKIKDMECEISRIRHEIEHERAKKSEVETVLRNESVLKQAYDKASHSLKTQKLHIDEL